MKIIADYWFTGMVGSCGIVIGEDSFGGERKAYIGVVDGKYRQTDIERIMAYGQKLPPVVLEEILGKLKPQKRA